YGDCIVIIRPNANKRTAICYIPVNYRVSACSRIISIYGWIIGPEIEIRFIFFISGGGGIQGIFSICSIIVIVNYHNSLLAVLIAFFVHVTVILPKPKTIGCLIINQSSCCSISVLKII